MDAQVYAILIIIAFGVQLINLVYKEFKDRNRKRTYKEIFLEIFLILIGVFFNFGLSAFLNYLEFIIWSFVLIFILDLWFRAKIVLRIGKWYMTRFNH